MFLHDDGMRVDNCVMFDRLAVNHGHPNIEGLREEYMKHLLQNGQFEKAGQVFEMEGKYEQAVAMYTKSKRLVRLPRLLIHNENLLRDSSVVTNVIKNLLKNEFFEGAAEIYEKLEKPELAMQCYRKGRYIGHKISN